MTTEIRIVISADAANAEKAIDAVDAGVNRLGAGGKKVDNFNKSLDEAGRAARRTGAQMQNLSYQVTDIVTGLATGQSPFFVLLQQGGQLKDIFGGVLPALRALGSLFTVTRVLAGGAAAGLAAWAYAAYSGREAAKELEQYLRVSGNAALVTSSQYRAATAQIAASNNLSIGSVREVGEAVLRTGQFTRDSYGLAVTAAAQFQKATGATTEEAVKQFAGITKGVTAWATEANKSYNFVTAAQLEQIRALEVQGSKQEAVRLGLELFSTTIKTRVEPNLSLLGRTAQSVGNFFSEMWEKAKGTFVNEGPEERIIALRKSLEDYENRPRAGEAKNKVEPAYITQGKAELRRLLTLQRVQAEAGAKLAGQQAENNAEIERNSDQFRAAIQGKDQEAATQRLAVLNLGLDRATSAYRQAYQEQLISAEGYQAALYAIDQQRLAAERATVAESIRIEQSRAPIEKPAQIAQQTKLLGLQTRLLEIDGKRAQLREDEDAGKRNQGFFETGADRITAAEDEAAQQRSKRQDELRKQRYDSADIAYAQLEAQTNRANAKALLTAEERGRAEIDEAVRVWREKIDVDSLYGQAQLDAEKMLSDFRVAEEARLTQRLRPEWQQRLLEWQDVNKLMKDASDETWSGVLRNAEDAFVQLVTTGKVSFEALVREFLITQAKMEFRRLVGGASGSLLGDLFKAGMTLIGGGAGGATASIGGYASVAGISGGRAMGGDVAAGGMYRINERGPGEIATVGGKDYLMMGANSGRVRPASQGRNVSISAPLTLYIDSRTDQAQIAQIAGAAVEQGRQRTFEELRAARVL